MEFSTPQEAPAVNIHAPFSRAERMDQLAEIDRDIASLLELSGKAIQSLGKQDPAKQSNSNTNSDTNTLQADGQPAPPQPLTTEEQIQEQTQAFQENMGKFLTTLHSVDVRLKRQIFGLEEAGILTLDDARARDKDAGPGPAQRPTLEPNGLGLVGNIDVGWLNSRSNQVEREMETELWTAARGHLENVAGRSDGNETNMTG